METDAHGFVVQGSGMEGDNQCHSCRPSGKLCHVDLGDIIIYSEDVDMNIKDIKSFLQHLQVAGMNIKPSKFQFSTWEVKYSVKFV